jgi:hypothetical protein
VGRQRPPAAGACNDSRKGPRYPGKEVASCVAHANGNRRGIDSIPHFRIHVSV